MARLEEITPHIGQRHPARQPCHCRECDEYSDDWDSVLDRRITPGNVHSTSSGSSTPAARKQQRSSSNWLGGGRSEGASARLPTVPFDQATLSRDHRSWTNERHLSCDRNPLES